MRLACLLAALWAPTAASAVAMTNYAVSGTFLTQSGASWATLSGGSFKGSFSVAANSFPLPANTNRYLYASSATYSIDIFTAAGVKITTLKSGGSAYFQTANTLTSYYGGENLTFVVDSNNYLQMIVPLTFDGTGSIIPGNRSSYSLALGTNYATIASGTITAIPEPATWAVMALGFGVAGAALRRRHHFARV